MTKLKIGIQGEKGSTNERACLFFAEKYNWQDYEIQYLVSTEKVLKALTEGSINYGTFAWQSSRGGLVQETQEAIRKYFYEKIDEVPLELDHALLGKGDINYTKIIKIYSHPQALKEHRPFLEKAFSEIELLEESGTATAAAKMQSGEYPENSLIIAPIGCAEIYNLKIYQAHLPTNQGYVTTIYLVKKKEK